MMYGMIHTVSISMAHIFCMWNPNMGMPYGVGTLDYLRIDVTVPTSCKQRLEEEFCTP